jgi:hypothetical protein
MSIQNVKKNRITTAKKDRCTDPFCESRPVLWNAKDGNGNFKDIIYSTRRNHGVNGTYKLHNLNDEINEGKSASEKIIVNYKICDSSYPLFTGADLLYGKYPYDSHTSGNILGEIAERISRRITKYFLKHCCIHGKTGGIFDQRFDPKNREDFIIQHTSDYILKIQQYPNLIILKRTGRGKFGYENIKELDGFFDYRYMGKRHILVLESKLEKLNVDCEDLISNLFSPLRQLFPDAQFNYVLFSDKNSIYIKSNYERRRQIKQLPVKIYERLSAEGIGSLFFTFNESRDDFEKIKDFLMLQYRTIRNLTLTLHGKTIISEKELAIFDGGETPHIKLVKDSATGLWKEVSLRHKKSKN